MKFTRGDLLLVAFLLINAIARAENAVVLESFESNIDAATIDLGSDGRPVMNPPGVGLQQYVSSGGRDANVSEGKKSLKVVLSGRKKFSRDFVVKLSPKASNKVRQAAASSDIARFVLRYDVIFPPLDDFVYFNSALLLGDSRDILISSGGLRTMSVALDLLAGIPSEGPLTLTFADDFEVKGDFTNVVIYLDNIRLVDTYTPGARPVVHLLQSFEDTNNPTGGAINFTDWDTNKGTAPRTTFAQYTTTNSHDSCVSDGQHALQVINHAPNSWHADFVIPFNHTKLADVLQLDKPPGQRPTTEQLSHYTLRWDIVYPEMTNDWINSTFHTFATFLPMIQGSEAKNRRLTYSITLDQTEWGTWTDLTPVLLFITEGPQTRRDIKIYYDNFRLIDTGSSAPKKKERSDEQVKK